jgi:uncharacterized protein YcbX
MSPHPATVREVHAFVLKSAGAPACSAVRVDASGVLGDRTLVVVDSSGGPADGTVLTVERAPQLRSVSARAGSEGGAVLDVPGLGSDLAGRDADAALTALLGRPVRVETAERGSQIEAPVHLVSVQALAAAARGEHDAADCACSLEEPRANLVVDLGGEDRREEDWVGQRLQVGEATLRVSRRPGHCLGVYAEVLTPGQIRPGDAVRPVADVRA